VLAAEHLLRGREMGGMESAQGIERKQPIDPTKQNQNQTRPWR
jgi:hypothetical protein